MEIIMRTNVEVIQDLIIQITIIAHLIRIIVHSHQQIIMCRQLHVRIESITGIKLMSVIKKRNYESRSNNISGNANVSNEGRGTHSINQIIAEQPAQDSSTSLQL